MTKIENLVGRAVKQWETRDTMKAEMAKLECEIENVLWEIVAAIPGVAERRGPGIVRCLFVATSAGIIGIRFDDTEIEGFIP